MESNYDEDLRENVFFKILQNDHKELFKKATENGWIICVPRMGSMPGYALTFNDFHNHILVPSTESPETQFCSLSDKQLKITNRIITVENKDISDSYCTHILFEETFYTDYLLKYKVLCLDFPLQECSLRIKNESGIKCVNTLRDCIDLLWTESSREVLDKMDDNINAFLSNNAKLELKSLQVQKDLVGALYTRCLQIALQDARLKEKTQMNKYLLDNVKVSVESYVHHGIYRKLIGSITECTSFEDACFNKIVRNLSDITLRDLDINPLFESVIPKARNELCRVENCTTILSKVGCLKKAIDALTKKDYKSSNALAADELLPLLVFLVIKTGLANWMAHLTYMKEFCFFSGTYHTNQYNFLITSLEAAVTHVKNDLLIGPSDPESQINYSELKCNDSVICSVIEFSGSALSTLFEMAKLGNEEEVNNILKDKQLDDACSFQSLNLCHPLCSCEKCERELNISKCNVLPTVDSCDDSGFTVLHVASMFGQFQVVDMLLNMGANPNKSDYKGATPFHYACARGHQSAVLLLMSDGAEVDQQDNDGNTGLHLAVGNGHETSVKAILYFTEQTSSNFNINCTNNLGNTALHYAARWGYASIVTLLLEYGANPKIKNKLKLTPSACAHSMHISHTLRSHQPMEILTLNSIALSKPKEICSINSAKNSDASNSSINTSKDRSREVERVLHAIRYGDERLACFYLGLERRTPEEPHTGFHSNICHPLCVCKTKDDIKVTAHLSVDVGNTEGVTPLHVSSVYDRIELVKLLIQAGADVNVQTKTTSMTPLHLACNNQRIRIVEVLLKTMKCDLNIQDKLGNTALHYVCQSNNTKLLNLLLSYSPDINKNNNYGKSPLDLANDFMSFSVVKLLNTYNCKTQHNS